MNHEEYLKLKEEAIERGEEHALLDIAYELHLLREAVQNIAGLLTPQQVPTKLVVTILDSKGKPMSTPVMLLVGQTFTVTGAEFNADGSAASNSGPLAFSSDNTAVATVDPVTGAGVAVAAGTFNAIATDSVSGLSGSAPVTDNAATPVPTSLVVTVTPGPAPAAALKR
jgi:hypothetical protein